jgi:hypothetical protein
MHYIDLFESVALCCCTMSGLGANLMVRPTVCATGSSRGLSHSEIRGGARLSQCGEELVHETHQAASMLSFTQLAN